MAQSLTLLSILACLAGVAVLLIKRSKAREPLAVSIHLDRSGFGAHLIWEIANTSPAPLSLTKLVIHTRNGATAEVPLGMPHLLASSDSLTVPTDVDWNLLAARSIAVVDAEGHEHAVSRRRLAQIQDDLKRLIDRRAPTMSARDFLFGATDMAFGVLILGLGFFMLMWMIATG